MYRFSREGREIAVISLFAAPFARVGEKTCCCKTPRDQGQLEVQFVET